MDKLEERAILMAESAFQQWLAVSGYCAARPFARLPSLIVLESVAFFVTYSQGRPFQQLVGCLLTLPFMLRGQACTPLPILPCVPSALLFPPSMSSAPPPLTPIPLSFFRLLPRLSTPATPSIVTVSFSSSSVGILFPSRSPVMMVFAHRSVCL